MHFVGACQNFLGYLVSILLTSSWLPSFAPGQPVVKPGTARVPLTPEPHDAAVAAIGGKARLASFCRPSHGPGYVLTVALPCLL